MRAEEIREGDIVKIDYITEFTKEHINEGKALVIWKGFNNQPLVRKLDTKRTIWDCYEHIAKVVGHIDIEGYMDKALEQDPCEDAISRKAVINTIFNNSDNNGDVVLSTDLMDRIKHLPSVTPQPKTGHWMYDDEHSDWSDVTYKCSCCKRAISVPYEVRNEVYRDYPFCHCGAKMIEPQESEEKE